MNASMNVIYGLWCACHPDDGIRYVGQTAKGITARFGVHLAHSEWSKSPVYNWMRKHGPENICWTVLEVCLPDELDKREEAWISQYRELQGAKLMNVRAGGPAARGYKNPAQSAAIMGEKNPMYGLDRRDSMAHARSFQNRTSEDMAAMARMHVGWNHTEESKEKMSQKQKDSWTEERKEKARLARQGSGNQSTSLTEDDVRKIRRIRKEQNLPYGEIGDMFALSAGAVSMICRRITWKHVD